MEIFWLSNNTESYASIYETNITLNTASSCHFINSYKTLIGFDKESKYLVIKSLNKDESLNGGYSDSELHPISIKKSYGRINGKNIIKNLQKYYPLDFSNKNLYKFKSYWDDEKKYLIIDLKEEIK